MSGVEVAGLILGALPLVISGLEHYAEGVEGIRRIKNAAEGFRSIARKLGAEGIVFRNTLEIFLQDCVDVETQKALLDDVTGRRWSEPNVEKALRDKLQESYPVYEEHIKSIEKSLAEFRRRLEIGDDGKGPFDGPISLRQLYMRIKFGIRRDAYVDLIKEINYDNTNLKRLTEQSRLLESSRRLRRIPNFDRLRSGAVAVYETLQRILHVSCHVEHKASICLQPHFSAIRGGEDSFRVILHHEGAAIGRSSLPWKLQETEIRTTKIVIQASVISSMGPATASVRTSTVSTKKGKSVAFNMHSLGSTNVQSQPPLNEIRDLCHSIGVSRVLTSECCLGFANSNAVGLKFYRPQKCLLSDATSLDQSAYPCSPLTSILGGGNVTNADAHNLAVSLASGMLQLCDTPWLNVNWNKADIMVISNNGRIEAQHPFITRNMHAPCRTQSAIEDASRAQDISPLIRNPTLFALGIILIELCMSKPIDQMHTASDLDQDGKITPLTDYLTAARLLDTDEIANNFGWRWSEVVRRCIFCDLNQKKPSLDNAAFMSAVYSDVLSELEEEQKRFFSI